MHLLCKIKPQIKYVHSSTPTCLVEGIAEPSDFWGEVIVPGEKIPYPIEVTFDQWINRIIDWKEIDGEWWWTTTDAELLKKFTSSYKLNG